MKLRRLNEELDFQHGKDNNVYYAYLKQRGEGCDYTIGCAQTLIQITAESFADAVVKLEKKIDEEYYGDTELQDAVIFDCEPTKIDLNFVYGRRQERIDAKNKKSKIAKERKEFERLRKKFGKN